MMRIGQLARATRTRTSKIRYYESIGLLPLPDRGENDQRVYGQQDIARVRFILHCRALGFTLKQIETFMQIARSNVADRKTCRDIVSYRLTSVQAQLTKLRNVEVRLVALLNDGETAQPEAPCRHLAALT